ncbi:MAG: putative metal-binding motif-containing protein [Myxococcales bacterium]|nr:putative metal-binding motif-containing protein [Myxococcales bacterium]
MRERYHDSRCFSGAISSEPLDDGVTGPPRRVGVRSPPMVRRLVWLGWLFGVVACSGGPDPGTDGGPGAMDATGPWDAGGCRSDEACDDGLFCNGVERCVEAACEHTEPVDCDDGVACTDDVCSEDDAECVHVAADADGDGVADAACRDAAGLSLGTDCDDGDADRFPDNPERCDDGHDEDCDPSTVGDLDADSDGHVSSACCNVVDGSTTCGDDCDDARGDVFTGAVELCDGRDNDCDDAIDDGLSTQPYGIDCDGDGFGVPADPPVMECGPPDTPIACDGGVWVEDVTDCDDTTPLRNPGLVEVCDGLDNDCDADGAVDEGLTVSAYYPDCDGDGFGDDTASASSGCAPPEVPPPCTSGGAWVTNATDCDDDAAGVNPRAPEVCNAIDDDCDTLTDDLTDGVVVCVLGTSQSCSLPGGGTGTQDCTLCDRWDPCR